MGRKRYYEWRRTETGEKYGQPLLCENACEFFLRSTSKESGAPLVGLAESATPEAEKVVVFVVATGERVTIEIDKAKFRARLNQDPTAQWYRRDGSLWTS